MNKKNGERRIVVFDGVCNLCNRTVDFLIKNDPDGHLSYIPLQACVSAEFKLPDEDIRPTGNTVIFIDRGEVYTHSEAILRVLKYLRFPWPAFCIFRIIPRPLRDWLYDFIAEKRYKWFGKRNECRVMSPEDPNNRRFLREIDQDLFKTNKSNTDKKI